MENDNHPVQVDVANYSVAPAQIIPEPVFEPTADFVDLTNTRLTEIPPGLRGLQNLSTLILRQNAIEHLPPFSLLDLPALTSLDLYANQIGSVEDFFRVSPNPVNSPAEPDSKRQASEEGKPDFRKQLTSLDLSFNQLRTTTGLEELTHLNELFLVNNKITEVVAGSFANMTQLAQLELGANRLREIKNLDGLAALQKLFLGQNKITALSNLEAVPNLRILSLQSNRLVSVGPGLRCLAHLEELYLSENGIEAIVEGEVDHLTNLKVLDIAGNRIKTLRGAGLEKLHLLTEFWVNNNYLTEVSDLEVLSNAKDLETVYLEKNPVQRSLGASYVRTVRRYVPSISQLDADCMLEPLEGDSMAMSGTAADN